MLYYLNSPDTKLEREVGAYAGPAPPLPGAPLPAGGEPSPPMPVAPARMKLPVGPTGCGRGTAPPPPPPPGPLLLA